MTIGPLVSVIIPAYNSANYIVDAISSVLYQTYRNFEIILVDDGSTDNTRAVLRPYGDTVHYLFQKNLGVSAARNLGIQNSRGELVAFLDADDMWLPDKLERQIQFMGRHTDVGIVFGDAELFDETGTVVTSFLSDKSISSLFDSNEIVIAGGFSRLLDENFIITSTVLARRGCLEAVGGFDESLRSVEDRDLWLRIASRFPIGCVGRILGRKRMHRSNISSDVLLATRSRVRVLEKVVRSLDCGEDRVSGEMRSRLARAYFSVGYCYFERGEYHEARSNFMKSIKNRANLRASIYYVATFLAKGAILWARRVKRCWK